MMSSATARTVASVCATLHDLGPDPARITDRDGEPDATLRVTAPTRRVRS